MIHGSHSPGQQFLISLVKADDGWSRFPLSENFQLIQQGWIPLDKGEKNGNYPHFVDKRLTHPPFPTSVEVINIYTKKFY